MIVTKIFNEPIGIITHDALTHHPDDGINHDTFYVSPGYITMFLKNAELRAKSEAVYKVLGLYYVNPDEGITYDDQLREIYDKAMYEIYGFDVKRELVIEDDLPDFNTLKPWD